MELISDKYADETDLDAAILLHKTEAQDKGKGKNVEIRLLTEWTEAVDGYDDSYDLLRGITASLSNALTVGLSSGLSYLPGTGNYRISFKGQSIRSRGLFLAYRVKDYHDELFFNGGPLACAGVCKILSDTVKGRSEVALDSRSISLFSPYVESALTEIDRLSALSPDTEDADEGIKTPEISNAEYLFRKGASCIVCCSENEYSAFMEWLSRKGYHLSPSLNPLLWAELRKYISCKPGSMTVSASHRIAEGTDCLLTAYQLMSK